MDILNPGVFIGTWRHLYGLQSPPPSSGKYIYNGGCVVEGGWDVMVKERESERGKVYYWNNLIKYSYIKICRTKSKHFVTRSDHHFGKSFYPVFHALYLNTVQFTMNLYIFNYWVDPALTLVYRTHSLCTYYKKTSFHFTLALKLTIKMQRQNLRQLFFQHRIDTFAPFQNR